MRRLLPLLAVVPLAALAGGTTAAQKDPSVYEMRVYYANPGKLDAQNARDRVQGIRDSLAKSKIRILDVRTDDVDDVRAKANAADTLVRYPNVKALVGLWSYNGPAILNAVREAGKVGSVKIIAFDEADETLAGISAGAIEATVVQQPYEFGYQAIHKMAQAARLMSSTLSARYKSLAR